MQEIRSSNLPVVTGICDSNKSRARHHHRLNQLQQKVTVIYKNAVQTEHFK